VSRSDLVRIELRPLARSIEVERGTPLRDVLFEQGVEFPCGGRGRCRRCSVQVIEGELSITPEQEAILPAHELAAGWRLGCRSRAEADVVLKVVEWAAPVLVDHSAFAFSPRPGFGVAVDLGTTTLAAQLLDLQTGEVMAVQTALNPQAAYGGDVMSRIQFALEEEDGRGKLSDLIRRSVGELIARLTASAKLDRDELVSVVIVGNTTMHHLFCGLDPEPLSHFPFEAPQDGLQELEAAELGWELRGNPRVCFLPCLGGFVGSDVLAGVLATKMHESDALAALIDLGTNGEIVLGNRRRMLCTSTAAGPAFEAGGIRMGMQATSGAISEVSVDGAGLCCRVLGEGPARGICGSGLVDAVAVGLDLGRIEPSGRLTNGGRELELVPPVSLVQMDIRQLQLAKGAIAAGVRILLERLGARSSDLDRVYLAGAFGNYVSRASARRIGMLDFADEVVEPAGNTALLGAKLALFGQELTDDGFAGIRGCVEHLSLAMDLSFQKVFVDEMGFPPGRDRGGA
jgi:uncharacterized 2Fe-2S/4Fe-4S cluster protein (DUF4445 family)